MPNRLVPGAVLVVIALRSERNKRIFDLSPEVDREVRSKRKGVVRDWRRDSKDTDYLDYVWRIGDRAGPGVENSVLLIRTAEQPSFVRRRTGLDQVYRDGRIVSGRPAPFP